MAVAQYGYGVNGFSGLLAAPMGQAAFACLDDAPRCAAVPLHGISHGVGDGVRCDCEGIHTMESR